MRSSGCALPTATRATAAGSRPTDLAASAIRARTVCSAVATSWPIAAGSIAWVMATPRRAPTFSLAIDRTGLNAGRRDTARRARRHALEARRSRSWDSRAAGAYHAPTPAWRRAGGRRIVTTIMAEARVAAAEAEELP